MGLVLLPVPGRDGGQPRRVRRPRRAGRSATTAAGPGPAARPGRTATASLVETTDGTYRCRMMVVAVGVAEPHTPPGPGMELTDHYADVRPVETYAGRRVFIAGKQNSGFELATGLLPWARQIVLASPSHGAPVGRHPVAGRCPRPLRAAVRGPRPGRRRERARRRDRADRARRRAASWWSTCDGPTAAPTWSSRLTTPSPRPGS